MKKQKTGTKLRALRMPYTLDDYLYKKSRSNKENYNHSVTKEILDVLWADYRANNK